MPDTATSTAALSLGARLRAARERMGIDKQQAAEKLHCDTSIIDALESDRFEMLGAPVYVRGHVRRYAELVAESPGEVQELCGALAAQSATTPDLTRIPKGERPADPTSLVRPLIGVGVVLLIAAATWWVLKGQAPRGLSDVVPLGDAASSEQPSAPGPTIAGTVPAATPAANAAAESNGIPGIVAQEHNLAPADTSTTASTSAALTAAAASGSASAPAAASGQAANPVTAAAVPGSTQLRVTADMDCWIEAYDASGKRIYFGMASPRSVQQITGVAPLRVLLGNVRSVKFEVDGRLTTIPESVRRGTSAWFAVSADGQIRPSAELPASGAMSDTRKPAAASKPGTATRSTAKPRPKRP